MDNHARPRAKFTVWFLLNGKLPTKDRLKKFGVIDSSGCSFCDAGESMDHLFFACSGFCSVWREVLGQLNIRRKLASWENEKNWLNREANKNGWKAKILKLASIETIYELWRSKNKRLFNHKKMDSTLVDKIMHNIVTRSNMYRDLADHVTRIIGRN
ncbi:unnamed protein product [Lathyrus sativus]|nr:unnamed protein product [Lathyrus sativus]